VSVRAERVVERVPLAELWAERGPLPLARVGELADGEAERLLAARGTRVVLAEPGAPLRWLAGDEVGAFWRAERAAGWRASEWRSDCGPAVVLLERAG
jgi:hypothetical protein